MSAFFYVKKILNCYILMMMLFTENTTNTFWMSLSEQKTLDSPYYLFVFFDYLTNSKVKCVLQPDESNERYDKVIIIEKNNPDTDNGEIKLNGNSGEYAVYEKSGIDYAESGVLIERGLWSTSTTLTGKPSYGNNQERAVYNG